MKIDLSIGRGSENQQRLKNNFVGNAVQRTF
jgi:hypothetical protein